MLAKDEKRGLKSLRRYLLGSKVRGCYMLVSNDKWTKEDQKEETRKGSNSFKDEIKQKMQEIVQQHNFKEKM